MKLLSRISLAFRFAFKRKGFATINILGLALGIAACIYITEYVMFHFSFDKHIPELSRTYRVTYQRWQENGDRVEFASASPTIGPAMAKLFPEVETFGRAFRVGGVFAYNDLVWEEENAFRGETDLIKILGFDIVNGSIDSCLSLTNQAVISETTALKYFGSIDPVGKTLTHNGGEKYVVSAVYKDPPANSHFKPDLFISLENWIRDDPQMFEQGWFYSGFYTYVTLSKYVNPGEIDKKIEDFIDKEYGEHLAKYQMGISFRLQPVADIHLKSHFMHELELNSDANSISLLQIIAWFILVVAWVNFFNLSTISSLKRVKEIGIRKVNGASRSHLVGQLLLESAIINLCAIMAAIVMFELGYNSFANMAGLPPCTNYYQQPWFYAIGFVALIVGTLSAGIYSVVKVKDNNLSESLRGAHVGVKGNTIIKKGLVAFQFTIAIALLAATIGVYKQFTLLQDVNLGFRLNDMVVVKVPRVGDNSLPSRFDVFIQKATSIHSVKGATYSSVVPGKPNMFNRGGIHRYGDDSNNSKNMRLTEIFANFPRVYNIDLLAGNGFTGNPAEDSNSIMLNEYGAQWLGFEDVEKAIGSQIVLEGIPKTLVGILYNFKQLSPKEEIEPQIFRYPQRFQGYFTLHIDGDSKEETIKDIKRIFETTFPGNAYEYFFLDEYYNNQYQHDKRFGLVFILFSGLSIAITILGLLGLSAYSAEQRKREIGIRKVLGASPLSVVRLLFRDYILLLAIAGAIAIPTVVKFLNNWLQNFATKISVDWTLFILPLITVFAVAFLTVLVQSLQAALENPVEMVRQE
jgi:putative ABC transport system permease protein